MRTKQSKRVRCTDKIALWIYSFNLHLAYLACGRYAVQNVSEFVPNAFIDFHKLCKNVFLVAKVSALKSNFGQFTSCYVHKKRNETWKEKLSLNLKRERESKKERNFIVVCSPRRRQKKVVDFRNIAHTQHEKCTQTFTQTQQTSQRKKRSIKRP